MTDTSDIDALARALESEAAEPPQERAGVGALMEQAATALRSLSTQLAERDARIAELERWRAEMTKPKAPERIKASGHAGDRVAIRSFQCHGESGYEASEAPEYIRADLCHSLTSETLELLHDALEAADAAGVSTREGWQARADSGAADGMILIPPAGFLAAWALRAIAGCRYFTMAEAHEHWQRTRGGTPLGDETFAILDALKALARIKAEGAV